jgi:glycogen(starch) synthase
MRVLFWSETFWPNMGGVEVMATTLLPALRERGHDFLVITTRDPDDLPDEARFAGIPVYRFPFRRALGDRDVRLLTQIRVQFAKRVQAFEPDLIHLHFVGPSALLLQQSASARDRPLLVALRRSYSYSEQDALIRATLRAATWVVAVSAAVLDEARRQVPEITARSSVILNSRGMPALLPSPLPFEPPRLLCLGRLVRDKGFDVALRAFATVVERFPTSRLLIAGDGVEQPALEARAASLGIASAVEFVGWVNPEEVPGLLNAATAVLMPSRTEGLPQVALQAAQMARPIVATAVGGLPEVVVDGETGILVEPEDSQALAVATARLLEQPETARRMGAAGRRRAQEMFDWERHVAAYDGLYRKLAQERSAVPRPPQG